MKLTKVKGNTYFIQAPTNIGVYSFKNKNCLLVDTGINNSQAKKIDDILIENNLHPKYIVNTHSHMDHCGGDFYFQGNYTGSLIYSSELEKVSMENHEIFPATLFSVPNNFKELSRLNKDIKVDYTLEIGTNKINDEKFEIISLPGHTIGQIGIITPEKVCFLGDSIFSENILNKYHLPYFIDIEKSVQTLKSLKEVDADYFIISHAESVINKDELLKLIDLNLKAIDKFKNDILELLDQPQSKESILESIVVLNEMHPDFNEYHLDYSAISAYISYLHNKGLIEYSVEDGKLYFYAVKR